MGPGGGPGPLPTPAASGLTDAQKEQVKGILSERSEQNAGQTLAKLHQDLTAAVMADVPDTARISSSRPRSTRQRRRRSTSASTSNCGSRRF